MLDRIDSIEKILQLSIHAFTEILESERLAGLGPSFNARTYFRRLQEGVLFVSLLITTVEVRISTPSRDLQDPSCPLNTNRNHYILKEQRKLRRCLNLLRQHLILRDEVLEEARARGWY